MLDVQVTAWTNYIRCKIIYVCYLGPLHLYTTELTLKTKTSRELLSMADQTIM